MINWTNSSTSLPGEYIPSYWAGYIFAFFLNVISMTGIIGNALVVISVFFSTELQTKTNVFVVNLAFCDIMLCIVGLLDSIGVFGSVKWPNKYCLVVGFISLTLLHKSISNLAMIALNRFVKIVKPRGVYSKIFTKSRMVILECMVWLISMGSVTLVFSTAYRSVYEPDMKMCGYFEVHQNGTDFVTNVVNMILIGQVSMPVILMIVCYIKIAVHIRANTRRLAAFQEPAREERVPILHVQSGPSGNGPRSRNRETVPTVSATLNDSQAGCSNPCVQATASKPSLEESTAFAVSEHRVEAASSVPSRQVIIQSLSPGPSHRGISADISPRRETDRHLRPVMPIRRVRLQAARNGFSSHDVKVTKNMALVTTIFLVCYVPTCTVVYNTNFVFYNFVVCLVAINSSINPFIYAYRHAVFKTVFRCILKGSLRSIPSPSRPLRAILRRH